MLSTSTDHPYKALWRLIDLARGDTHQCGHVRRMLLAWWNAPELGGFDPTTMWAVDEAIAEDMLAVLRLIAQCRSYPDTLGLKHHFVELIGLEKGETPA